MNSIFRFIVCFVFILNSFCSYGQIRNNVPKSEIDSLINIIPNFHGTELVDHLNFIATSISQRYPDSCLYYANQALELSDSLNFKFGEAEAIFNTGNGYFYKIDLKNALTNYLAAHHIFEKFETSNIHGNLLLQIGFINTFVGHHEKSIEYYRQAQLIFSKTGNQFAEIFAKRKIGTAHRQMNNKDSALFYYYNVLKDYRKLGQKRYEAYVMNDIAITIVTESPDESLDYYENSLNIMYEIGYTYGISVRLNNIGEYYLYYTDEPDYIKAESYFLESIYGFEKIGRFADVAGSLATLAVLYLGLEKSDKVVDILEKGLKSLDYFYNSIDTMVYEDPAKKFREYVYAKEVRAWIYDNFERVYESEGDYKKALYYNRLKVKAEDGIYAESNRRQTEIALANAENESVTKKIELLEKEKALQQKKAQRSIIFLIGSGILILLIVLIAILYNRQNKLRIEQDKTNLQQKLLRTQMNPHFLFNSLSSIQNFIIKEKPALASDYLGRFSKLVRQILNNSVEEWVPLEDEIESIENYLELQKVRHRDMFDYSIDVDEAIDPETIQVPPMLAQPFIENSIEHGFKQKNGKGHLKIQFKKNGKLISFELEDDGIGREKAMQIVAEQNRDHRSMSSEITRQRLKVLSKKTRQKINLSIIDLKDEKRNPVGTKVAFDIPFRN